MAAISRDIRDKNPNGVVSHQPAVVSTITAESALSTSWFGCRGQSLVEGRQFLHFLKMRVMRGNPVRTQMVNEILENVHHIGGNVVKGNGVIAAAIRPTLGRVEDIAPIPHVFGHVFGNEVVLGADGERTREKKELVKNDNKKFFLHSKTSNSDLHKGHEFVPA